MEPDPTAPSTRPQARDDPTPDPTHGRRDGSRPAVSPLGAAPSALTFAVAVWLAVAPYSLDYRHTGDAFNGYWNDIVIGFAIAVVALIRIAVPTAITALSMITALLGAWLVVAPFLLGYNDGTDAPRATWNDIIVGVAVIALTALEWGLAPRTDRRQLRSRQARSGE